MILVDKCELKNILDCIKRAYTLHDSRTEDLCLAIRGLNGLLKRENIKKSKTISYSYLRLK